MLEIKNIKKSFNKKIILDNVSFIAKDSSLTIIEGQNGAGKSTLFNVITGLLPLDEGAIFLNKNALTHLSAKKRAVAIGILRQDPFASSVASFTLLENFSLALLKNETAGLKKAISPLLKEKVQNHLETMGLDFTKDLSRPMTDFSGGQRQMLAFALATITQPKLLLLDEPTAALDEKSAEILIKLVKKLIKEWQVPAVMISHDLQLNRRYGDEILHLLKGKIV